MKKRDENLALLPYHNKTSEEVFKELKTSKIGLAKTEAEKRLKSYGKNELKKIHKLKPLKIFIQQFNSFFVYILLVAALVSFLINHFIDGAVIAGIIVLNVLLGFFQQYKAEKAIESLKKLMVQKSRVIRDGRLIQIDSLELVPGDIMMLEAGDKINADCRIISANNLQTSEAVLTGESLPVAKFAKTLSHEKILAEQSNMLFAGTQVVAGSSKALVVATGMNTEFGKIAESLQEIEEQKTPMQKRLDTFSKQIGVIILLFVGVVMLLGLSKHFDTVEIFLTAVALAVSAIPEGLPAVLTISFAISALLMSKQNVIIRRLPAVESLGSATVICSDKTGTITEEKMQVKEIFSNNNFYLKKGKALFLNSAGNKKVSISKHKELTFLLKTSILCNNARFEWFEDKNEIIGDPTESALVAAALDLNLNKKIMCEKEPSIKKFEFSSYRKMMSVLRNNGRSKTLYSKGAPEKILELSSFELVGSTIKKLTNKRKQELLSASRKMEDEALRVLGFAYKNFSRKETAVESGLIFLGFVGMIDPPRKEIKEAVRQCKSAGIKVKIITGDSILTANAIAKQIGIKGDSITGEELEKMSDKHLSDVIDKITVFARTTPKQKLRITQILQQKGEVVAMTGDGVNDSLALKAADIGIAMGKRGTDVARDVSDVVLVDDNFASIVEGVKYGRKTYDNIKKFTKYMLAVNFSGIFLILFSLMMAGIFDAKTWYLPLLPLQILWVNLVTDSFPAMALIMEKQEDVMRSSPRNEKSILSGVWKFIVAAGIFTVTVKIFVYVFGVLNDFAPARTRTIVLTTVVLFEMFFVYTCRSKKSILDIGIFSNKWLNVAVLFSLCAHMILLYSPLASLFGVVGLSVGDWLYILPLAFSGVFVFEVGKIVKGFRVGRN